MGRGCRLHGRAPMRSGRVAARQVRPGAAGHVRCLACELCAAARRPGSDGGQCHSRLPRTRDHCPLCGRASRTCRSGPLCRESIWTVTAAAGHTRCRSSGYVTPRHTLPLAIELHPAEVLRWVAHAATNLSRVCFHRVGCSHRGGSSTSRSEHRGCHEISRRDAEAVTLLSCWFSLAVTPSLSSQMSVV